MSNEDGSVLVADQGTWGSAGDELNSGQGFGYIGKCWIGFGYKVYIKGIGNQDSFFPFEFKNKDSAAKAQLEANALYAKHDMKNRDGEPQVAYPCFAIRLYKANVLSKDASAWLEDKWWVYPLWTVSTKVNLWKVIVQPSLDKLKLKVGNQEVWGQVRYKVDPSGKTYEGKDAEGNLVQLPSMVNYISEVYANETEAKAHVVVKADAPASGSGKPTFPKGYTEAAWNELASEIKQAYDESKSNTKPEDFNQQEVVESLSAVYGLVVTWIKSAVGLKNQ
jgi:hypothetical protein